MRVREDNWLMARLGEQETWRDAFMLLFVPYVFVCACLVMFCAFGETLTARSSREVR